MENEGPVPRLERSVMFGASYELYRDIEASLRATVARVDVTWNDLIDFVSAETNISKKDVEDVLKSLESYVDKAGFVRLHQN